MVEPAVYCTEVAPTYFGSPSSFIGKVSSAPGFTDESFEMQNTVARGNFEFGSYSVEL